MRRARWEWTLQSPRDALWRWISDTDWVNRHAGLPRLRFFNEPREGGGSTAYATYRIGPFEATWEERPTQWLAPEYFSVERLYRNGPLRRFYNRTELHEVDARTTRVVVDVELTARSPIFEPMLAFVSAGGKRGADRAFSLAQELAARGDVPMRPGTSLGRFDALRGIDVAPAVVEALEQFFRTSEPSQFARMQPYAIADRFNVPRREMLRAFLHGVRLSLFNLKWDVICPSCRGPKNSFDALERMNGDLHCDGCNLPYSPVFDRSVEVTFNAVPLGFSADVPTYCIASPQQSPHVLAQLQVPAKSTVCVRAALDRGTYDINAVGRMLVPFSAGTGSERAACTLLPRIFEVPNEVAAGNVEFEVRNELASDAVVRIERGRWPDTIATAAIVTSLPEFRDYFSSEVLAPGLELSVESLAVLFTDIVGSTAMYTKTGDAPSFRVVTDHFAVLREIVARNDGAIVKTIGDAIMATFNDPSKCFSAALEMDQRVRAIRVREEPLRLRVGFHVGPAIAMRANDRIDYFGSTVNLAARLEASASAGQIAFSAGVAEREGIRARLAAGGIAVERATIAIKGFERPVDVLKATLSHS